MPDIIIDEGIKHEIKTQANIEEVIGQYVTLIQEGALYRGLCPFHNEKTPSFTVMPRGYNNSEYGGFYCHGCHAGNREETNIGNDVIGFIMAIEEVDFMTACQMLCDKYNIPYQKRVVDPVADKMKRDTTSKNEEYYKNLMSNQLVLGYLAERGVYGSSLSKFRMGLTSSRELGWRKNRLVFGITDINYEPSKANTVGMGYRSLMGVVKAPDGMEYFPNDDPKRKYCNDSESKIFSKKKTMFGLNYAAKPIRKLGFAIVVEGYMDVVLMHQTGFENTIAPMGTSFTNDQMDILKKYTKQLLFFLDADERGLEAMRRTLPRLLEKGFSVLIIQAPQGKDPADLCLQLGQNNSLMANYIRENSTPALQWCVNAALDVYESKIHKAKLDALGVILPILDKVGHRESRIAYTSAIAKRLDVDAGLLLEDKPNIVQTPPVHVDRLPITNNNLNWNNNNSNKKV